MSSKQKFNSKEIQLLCKGKNLAQTIKAICGELIGSGVHRDVYVLKQNPDYVVKIERDPTSGDFANVTEWRNWVNNKEWKFLADWLAPCEMINENGQVLIQRRIQHRRRKFYPDYIPGIFTDTKLSNFGWIGDRFVCCDYSFMTVYFIIIDKNKMKRAKWWGSLKHLNLPK